MNMKTHRKGNHTSMWNFSVLKAMLYEKTPVKSTEKSSKEKSISIDIKVKNFYIEIPCMVLRQKK